MNKVYIEDYGLCSAFGDDLFSHVDKIKRNITKAQTIQVAINSGDEKFKVPFYKSKHDLNFLLNQIPVLPKDTALFIGSSSLGIELNEKNYKKDGFSHLGRDLLMPNIYKKLNIKGAHYIFDTACTSSANALIYAARMIQTGAIKNAIVLGVEMQNSLSLYGFMALGLLSNNELKPFDKHRDGLILGESYGFVYLSSETKKVQPWLFLEGESINDTTSPTTPSVDGSALSFVINKTLKNASIKPEQIDLIKLHGTATLVNDISENSGLCAVFKNIPTTTALKGYLGHTLGAGAVCELAFLLGSLDENIIPKALGFEAKDDSLSISPLTQSGIWSESYILLNHIAFGGNTTSFLVQKQRA